MRLARVRFTVRTMMVAVAVVAAAIYAAQLARRSRHFREQAEKNALSERLYIREAANWSAQTKSLEGNPLQQRLLEFSLDQADDFAKRAARNGSLKRKYRYASNHPWLPVEPDLPPW